MSRSLKAIGINSDTALDKFAALEKKSKQVQKAFGDMGRSIGSLKQKLDLLRSEREWIPASNLRGIRAYTKEIQKLEREIDKLENKGRRGFFSRGTGGGGMLMGLSRSFMPLAAASLLAMGMSKTVSAGMNASRQQASFETLSGKEAGGKLFTDVKKFAQESIYGNELYDNALQMRAFGVETEKIMPHMKMLGDISMGSKEKLSSLTLAFSQMNSAGRLMGQDLLQMVNAGFNPLTIIAQKTGLSMFELRKKMEEGVISSEMVTQAFKAATSEGGQFFNMTQKIAETPFGKWEAFKGQLEGIATDIGMKLLPVVSKVIDLLSKGADGFMKYFEGIWETLKPVVDELWPILEQVGEALWRVQKIIWNIATTIVKALGPVIVRLIKLLEGPLKVALNVAEFAFKALEKVVNAVAWAIDKVMQAFDWVSEALESPLAKAMRESSEIAKTQGESAAKAYLSGFASVMGGNKDIGVGASLLRDSRLRGTKLVDDTIAPPSLPGETGFDWKKSFTNNKTNNKRNKANESVATGGTKNTTIHITIGKQIESLQIVSNNIREGAEKIRDIIVDEMTRALAMSQAIAD